MLIYLCDGAPTELFLKESSVFIVEVYGGVWSGAFIVRYFFMCYPSQIHLARPLVELSNRHSACKCRCACTLPHQAKLEHLEKTSLLLMDLCMLQWNLVIRNEAGIFDIFAPYPTSRYFFFACSHSSARIAWKLPVGYVWVKRESNPTPNINTKRSK